MSDPAAIPPHGDDLDIEDVPNLTTGAPAAAAPVHPSGDDSRPVPVPAVATEDRRRPRSVAARSALGAGAAAWSRLKPAILLFGLLLLVNLVTGLAVTMSLASDGAADRGAAIALVVVGTTAAVADRRELRPLLVRSGLDGRRSLEFLVVTTVMVAFIRAYVAGLEALGFTVVDGLEAEARSGPALAFVVVSTLVLAPVFEELAFRGIIQGRLAALVGRRDAVIVQAAMFSVLHLAPASFPSHFVGGAALGLLRLRSGSLYPGMLAHFVWNGSVLLEDWYGG